MWVYRIECAHSTRGRKLEERDLGVSASGPGPSSYGFRAVISKLWVHFLERSTVEKDFCGIVLADWAQESALLDLQYGTATAKSWGLGHIVSLF